MAYSSNAISIIRQPAGLEQVLELSHGDEHMTISYNLVDTGQMPIIEFSHNSRTPRPDGWQRSFAAVLLANDNVRSELQRDGINPGNIMRLVNEQFRNTLVQSTTPASRKARFTPAVLETTW